MIIHHEDYVFIPISDAKAANLISQALIVDVDDWCIVNSLSKRILENHKDSRYQIDGKNIVCYAIPHFKSPLIQKIISSNLLLLIAPEGAVIRNKIIGRNKIISNVYYTTNLTTNLSPGNYIVRKINRPKPKFWNNLSFKNIRYFFIRTFSFDKVHIELKNHIYREVNVEVDSKVSLIFSEIADGVKSSIKKER